LQAFKGHVTGVFPWKSSDRFLPLNALDRKMFKFKILKIKQFFL